jgi:hypothetical protein
MTGTNPQARYRMVAGNILMSGYFNYAFKMKDHDATAYLGYRFYHLGLEDNTEDTSISVNIQGHCLDSRSSSRSLSRMVTV